MKYRTPGLFFYNCSSPRRNNLSSTNESRPMMISHVIHVNLCRRGMNVVDQMYQGRVWNVRVILNKHN